jgi:hypothetical protein
MIFFHNFYLKKVSYLNSLILGYLELGIHLNIFVTCPSLHFFSIWYAHGELNIGEKGQWFDFWKRQTIQIAAYHVNKHSRHKVLSFFLKKIWFVLSAFIQACRRRDVVSFGCRHRSAASSGQADA